MPYKARDLKPVPNDRRKKWLELAESPSKRAPSESTRRTVYYLIWLSNNVIDNNVNNSPPLPWHERREDTLRVDLSAPSVLGKLCPAMHFRATLS